MLATVAIAVCGDRRVYRLVESLLNQTFPKHEFEILVVENGTSLLGNVVHMCEKRIKYFWFPEANMATARNIALEQARGRYFLVTDSDVIAHPEWVKQMVAALDTRYYSVIGGRIEKFSTDTWIQRHAITIVDGQTELSYLPALPLPYVVGANAGFCTFALRNVGGFDVRLKSGNDVDACYRLGLAGHKIGLAPQALVWHEDRATISSHFRRFRHYAVYQVLLFAMYRHMTGRRIVLNSYPFKRFAGAIISLPYAIGRLFRGDGAPASRAFLQIVEACAIWCGDIQGSIQYRQLYL